MKGKLFSTVENQIIVANGDVAHQCTINFFLYYDVFKGRLLQIRLHVGTIRHPVSLC